MKQIIGRVDMVDFPTLEREDIRVKVDTGARSSAIHATRVHVEEQNGKDVLVCSLLGSKKKHTFQAFEIRKVTSSNGVTEKRFLVELPITIFGKTFKTAFTLTKRSDMRFPVLLGRRFLTKRFVVDVSKKNMSHTQKNEGLI